ncbi:hypothetical protein IQ272_24360 [Chroococcidiopsidales cyanobacterium LEGE 13417]|nr:hypothetical protein [Chroococcidiopsidales cyanobacterium LEGE 13417]
MMNFVPPPPQPHTWEPLCYLELRLGQMINLNSLCGVRLQCSYFQSKELAQAAFDRREPGTEGMDGDRDGKVCEWGTQAKEQGSEKR